ncbi:MAG TPA: metallophosphoesterase, partial [Candidatus Dormibacteraeota bacterium]|nr:metallophosphoesterase [Candidatus Dormibacteraeota bacterium]
MAAVDLPVLIVGDVHGDIERLFAALKPYPANEWRTIFLGDLVDYGDFGVGCLRYARDRKNSEVLLGNHEVAMLGALRDPSSVGFYISIGGLQHDLDAL